MEVKWPKAGKYVVAVSGGVDSMTLLNLLHEKGGYDLIVAHLDHGIRSDSFEDRRLVEETAANHGLPFVCQEIELGSDASEAKAREARYEFLRQVMNDQGAAAIITAHHQDDLLETAVINLLRGTGRKGLSSLGSKGDVIRPLLQASKKELIEYALSKDLKWREDNTNSDEDYLRNYVRLKLLPRLDDAAQNKLLNIVTSMKDTNDELDTLLVKYLNTQSTANTIDRPWFNNLPHNVGREVMAGWLRLNDLGGFDSSTLERLVVAAKVAKPGKVFPVMSGYNMKITKGSLALVN